MTAPRYFYFLKSLKKNTVTYLVTARKLSNGFHILPTQQNKYLKRAHKQKTYLTLLLREN